MAIAIHVGKIDKMSYDFKDLDHDVWQYRLAYKILRNHTKFMFQQSVTTVPVTASDNANDDIEPLSIPKHVYDSTINVSGNASASNSAANAEKQDDIEVAGDRPMGRKAVERQHEIVTVVRANMENEKSIARSLQHKAEFEEEKNDMKMYALAPCETDEDEKEKAEYFRMMRRRYLRRARGPDTSDRNNSEGNVSDSDNGAREPVASDK